MFLTSFASSLALLSNYVVKDPGKIVGPVAMVLGTIINFIFDFVYQITVSNSLGISIIILTIITRFIMLPLALQQHKSMVNMQKLSPELEKIKKKYGDKKDTETQQKMNAEIQRLYAEHKINPLMGCLPLVLQMPIFVALNYIMQQSFQYINIIGDFYYKSSSSLAQTISSVPGFMEFFKPLALPKLAKLSASVQLDMANPAHMAKVISRFNATDWGTLMASMPQGSREALEQLLINKNQVESFFGIDLVENAVNFKAGMPGIWPGILIPIVATVVTFLSSYLMSKQSLNADSNAQAQQKVLMYVMPIMMGAFTISFPAGVGLYWITSSVFQVGQQIVLNKMFKKNANKDVITVKGKEKPNK